MSTHPLGICRRPILLRRHGLVWLLLGLFAALLPGCASEARITVEPSLRAPWPHAEAAAVGLDAALLEQAIARLGPQRDHGLRSMLIVRHGRLAFERYWNGYGPDTLQDLRSITKSITSLLLGIAIDRSAGLSVGAPLTQVLDRADSENRPALVGITLQHLLTMRSGLACNDRDPRSIGQEDRMYLHRDWASYFLTLPRASAPGAAAHYCTGGVLALGRVIERTVGQAIDAFATQSLFGPLGIEHAQWARFDESRQVDTGGHLRLRPRDLARVGQLVLQRGQWQGRTLVPAGWIDTATREHTQVDGMGYGYLWWRSRLHVQSTGSAKATASVDVIFASGNGGQALFIAPGLGLVAVFTAGNYNRAEAQIPYELFRLAVLPALSDAPLPISSHAQRAPW